MAMCFNPYLDDRELNSSMKFDDLLKFEGFDSNQTQDAQTGNSGQNANPGNNLSPDQYRSTAASEYEEEKPYSLEKNKLKHVMEELKAAKSLEEAQIKTLIGKLADVFRIMN
jgi:hypothetical protein